jgi:hypothetical protein
VKKETYSVEFGVDFFLDFRVVQQLQEDVEQRRGGRLHAGDEQVDHRVQDCVVALGPILWIRFGRYFTCKT